MQCLTARSQAGVGARAGRAHAAVVARPGACRRAALRPAALFGLGGKKAKAPAPAPVKRPTVVPEPSFNLPLSLLAISAFSAYEGATPAAVLTGILGAFLALQATRVKFQFEDDALEVVIAGKEEQKTENAFVGGRNRWRFDSFINWELWWPGFPVLVYFKESQTKPEGQIHFFPVIFNGKQLYDVMVEQAERPAGAEDPREALRQEWSELRAKTRPRDTVQGMKSGLATAAAGVASGVVGLFAAPIVGAKQDGAAGFAKGLATGIAGAVVLPVAGVVGGAVQVGRGLANQSEANQEKKRGRVWDKAAHAWVDPPGAELQPYDADAADAALGRSRVHGPDFYELLEVSRDADGATLKRQYYVLARKYHPDKNAGDEAATQRFQQLGQAYQVLSNPELRAKYDKHGAAGLDVELVDAGVIFGSLFGSELFEPIVGEFMIATATSRGGELSEREAEFLQEARVGKLVVGLKARLAPFVGGEEEAFGQVQAVNAEQLAAASFGGVMLATIARVYSTEAEVFGANPLLGGLTKLRRAGDSIKSQLQAAKAAVDLAQHQAKLEAADAALKQHAAALQEQHGGEQELPELAKVQLAGMMQQRHELELAGMGLALQAMWAANVLDIQRTLHTVCKRLLREPGISKAEARGRAAALAELGRIYADAARRASAGAAASQEVQMQAALEKLKDLYMGAQPGDDGDDDGDAGGAAGPSASAARPAPNIATMRCIAAALLLAACLGAAQARQMEGDHAFGARALLQSDSEKCPIQFCKNQAACIYSSRTKRWSCTDCDAPRIPNAAKSECVCPAGMFPVAGGGCALCKANMYCPQGQKALVSTATACPANMVTLRRGAKSLNDCFNAPGYRFRKTSAGVRAIACGDNEYTVGLKKQTACNACPTNFVTDPDNTPGMHTSAAVCVAPKGAFVTGDSITLCPKGEFNDDYSLSTSCQTCEDVYGAGVTTKAEGSTSVNNCTWLEPGFVLLDDKKRAILGAFDPINTPISGAKKCPQNYYCPGGNPAAGGQPVRCPYSLWTEDEGASSVDECVAPPGMYYTGGAIPPTVAPALATVRDCPEGTFKETWERTGRSGCVPCGTGLWLSDKTIFLNDLDPNTGLVRRQIGVRGSSDSCYIQRGMGAILDRNQTGGASQSLVLRAFMCPVDTYGISGANVGGVFKKYGRVPTPCTQCPTNMKTGQTATPNDNRVASIQTVSAADSTGLTQAVTPVSVGGYYSIEACYNPDGYGYYAGAAQICPQGYFNIKGNKEPCTKCPFGTTTALAQSINTVVADCTKYLPGYGLVSGVPALCPISSYQVADVSTGTACTACPEDKTTTALGGTSLASCSACAAGWGTRAQNTTCVPCQDGYYGASDRGDTSQCVLCPADRTFTYDWQDRPDVFVPKATSRPYAKTLGDCVADFSQTVEGSSFLDLTVGANFAKVAGLENLETCVQYCRDTASCGAVTFEYSTLSCWVWTPIAKESFVATGGLAFKLFSSSSVAQSKKVTAKEMGSGEYSFIKDSASGDTIAASSFVAQAGVTSLRACQDACSAVALCAGIRFGQYTAPDTVASCDLIMAESLPGQSRRTLIKANFQGMNTDLVVSPGYYWDAASSTVKQCEAVDTDAAPGYFCLGGAVGAAPRTTCTADNGVGARTPAGAERLADCGATLDPGYYWDGTAVSPCPANSFCLGDIYYKSAAGVTPATPVGATDCPTGTNNAGANTQTTVASCTTILPGYYMDGAAVALTSVKECPVGFYCAGGTSSTSKVACSAGSTTPTTLSSAIADCSVISPGYFGSGATVAACSANKYCLGGAAPAAETACPAGTNSAAGSKSANDCTILLATYYYTGLGATIATSNVLACPAGSYCPAGTITVGMPVDAMACPTGSTSVASSDAIDDCDDLLPGYYYGGGSAAISAASVKLCDAGSFCDGATAITVGAAAVGIDACPTGSTSLPGQSSSNGCTKLLPGSYFTGGAAVTAGTIQTCPADMYCLGGTTVTLGAGAPAQGATACPTGTGTNTATGSSAVNDCTEMKPGYYYLGTGSISTSSVKLCPADKYCLGVTAVTVNSGAAQGATACPTGSGTAGVTGSDEVNDCTQVKPGYYFDGTGTAPADLAEAGAFKLCDVEPRDNTAGGNYGAGIDNSFCPGTGGAAPGGGLVLAVDTTSLGTSVGRYLCSVANGAAYSTSTTCAVRTGFEGQDCTSAANCVS
ncbi:ATJ10 [Scenedesmus sp. PABB004]|nr:ATJ10 [Scenedesmus sp. PABB004]